MSRLAKKPIAIPANTTVAVSSGRVSVKGPLGELVRDFKPTISITVSGDNTLILEQKSSSKEVQALWGTYASHVKNMLAGVNKPFEKKLIIEGIGFKAEIKGSEAVFNLGFSHPIRLAVPAGVSVRSEKGTLTISGINKESVGSFAAKIRDLKRPEPYKGKGIRYANEIIRRKQGKKAAAAGAA